ncbi:MAG: hypothetical protein LBU32_24235 [Clostridiales bacterium]|nr:hypothetical protein [Clostridiales bacterium]
MRATCAAYLAGAKDGAKIENAQQKNTGLDAPPRPQIRPVRHFYMHLRGFPAQDLESAPRAPRGLGQGGRQRQLRQLQKAPSRKGRGDTKKI